MKNKRSLIAVAATLAVMLMTSACTMESNHTTINTPALYSVSKDAAGALQTNLVSPASIKETIKKERLWLPEGYALLAEDDTWGFKGEMTSASSSLPNVMAGIHHGSFRWLPTSTNQLYAASMTASGSIDNKAVPFWMSAKGQFTAGPAHVSNASDTNGVTADAGMIVPGTPANQTK
ncbi:MAG: hypothetical protein P4N60_19230 [Verrucomicrobiae bacterium]|nr:hypothetical protein [Verrucomicrobiae bacterium]